MTPDSNEEPNEVLPAPATKRLQARIVPARESWLWIKDGWQLFRRQPMVLMGILAIYLFAMLVVSALLNFVEQGLARVLPAGLVQIIAIVAAAAVATTVPGITAGFMGACKNVLDKKPVNFELLLRPFKGSTRIRNGLLILGTLQALALIVAVAVTPDVQIATQPTAAPGTANNSAGTANKPVGTNSGTVSNPNASAQAPATTDPPLQGLSQEQRKKLLWATLLQMLIYLPVTLLLWYAPMLVYWHDCSASKAMFFSAAALWRNRAAFLAYFMLLSLILFLAAYVLSILLALLGLLLGLGRGTLGLVTPFVMVLLTWTYCTIYFSYRAVFEA